MLPGYILGAILLVAGAMWAGPASSTIASTVHEIARQSSYAILVYNEDQLKGQWKQFKGELKKKWGDLTDDDLLHVEGSMEKLDGKIQERYGDRREEVKQWVDEWFKMHAPKERRATN